MSRGFAAAAVVTLVSLVMPAEPAAHHLDEFLQATRVSLARNRIALALDLTPGANIASTIIALLDRDGDHAISPSEAAAYGQSVLEDLVLELDGRPVAVTLTHVEIPSIDAMRDGLGAIQLQAAGYIDAVAVGRRAVYFQNHHQPATSVYLVNALIPEDRDVAVLAQIRDPRQTSVRIEYRVGPPWIAQLSWLVFGALTLAGFIVFRERSPAMAA